MFGDDPETFREILTDFVQAARANVEEIEQANNEQAADGVRAAAHKLKSSARTVGANALADLCYVLEQAGKSGDWARIELAMSSLTTLMSDVAHFVEALSSQDA